MKYRIVEIFSGQRFRVPECIQRLDHRSTHGWQLRYGRSKMYSDFSSDGSGARAALTRATTELLRRIERLPAPSGLQRRSNQTKTSALPVGISGPIVRLRKGRAYRECSFGVSIPRFGEKPTKKSVHIGTENTFTQERYEAALARAVELRQNAEQAYRAAATKARRAQARKTQRGVAR